MGGDAILTENLVMGENSPALIVKWFYGFYKNWEDIFEKCQSLKKTLSSPCPPPTKLFHLSECIFF